ncbi:MAG: magnesium transporter CorA family protein [Pseudomonadota bacterium]
MNNKYCLLDNKLTPCETDEAAILVFVDPTDAEKRFLIDQYQLDEHTLNSALDPDELARIEAEPGHTAVILKNPKNYSTEAELEFQVASIGMFFFPHMLIIVMADEIPYFTGKSFQKINRLEEIMLRMINQSIIHFREHLQIIDRVSEELADKISTSMENRYLLYLFALEKSLVYYSNAITSNGVLLERMKNHTKRMQFRVEDIELLEDIIIENTQCYRQAKMYANILSSMMDARASIINNNLNILMKRLTIITISLMVPTLIVSTFSMNVPIPMQRLDYAFWIIFFMAILSMVGSLLFWKFNK